MKQRTNWPNFEDPAVVELVNGAPWGSLDPRDTIFEVMNHASNNGEALVIVRDMLAWWHIDIYRGQWPCSERTNGQCPVCKAIGGLNALITIAEKEGDGTALGDR